MTPQQRYNKQMIESKKLKYAIIMVVYTAESALYNTMSEFYKSTEKEGRVILKEIFTSDADMIPDYKNHTLTIKLNSLSTPKGKPGSERIMCLFKPDRNPFSTHKFTARLRNSRALICDSIRCLRLKSILTGLFPIQSKIPPY